MSNFGHVHKVTASVGSVEITFRSKLEYRWAVWCEIRKQQGLIQDWFYEDLDSLMVLKTEYRGNVKGYLPDFMILTNDDEYEIEETKGYFPPKDYTKLKLPSDMVKDGR